jgi:pilus assembly protein Flp/PilA
MPRHTTDNELVPTLAGREDGQALVEYALILLLVALVTVGALTAIGGSVSAAINAMAGAL